MSPSPSGSRGVAAGTVTRATTHVTSAQLLALKTTPVTLVAAPGAGFILLPLAVFGSYTFNTTPYVTANLEVVDYLGAAYEIIAPAQVPWLAAGASIVEPFDGCGLLATKADIATKGTNKALVLTMDAVGADPTGGNGTVDMTVLYTVNAT